MSTILAQQSLLPYWRHRAWGAIYLGVGVCTVYVHVPLVRSVNMVTHVPHVHTCSDTRAKERRNFFFSKEVCLICLFGAYLAPLPYGSTKKNLVLRSGAALDYVYPETEILGFHIPSRTMAKRPALPLCSQPPAPYCINYTCAL